MKEYYKNILKQLSKKKLTKYDFIGFDVETYGDDNLFYMGGLFYLTDSGKEVYKAFYDREEMIEFLLTFKFQGKYIVATNLGFDLSVLFFNTKYWNDLNILERGSNIIYAEYKFKNSDKKGKIKFIDTMNYVPFSVEKLGKIINIEKQEKPSFLGEIPKTKEEKAYLEFYNSYDCKISCKFMYFLQDGFFNAGGNLKITIASTSFDIWRRNFQPDMLVKEEFILNDHEVKNFIFKGYYGGRTEVFKKGLFKDVFYYDINSLYPSVMRLAFPLPQSIRKVDSCSVSYIQNYMGVTECTVFCPKMNKPFLPFRNEKSKKLLFPCGRFTGTWNNCELQKAVTLGYKIEKIHKQVIYTKNFFPFKEFVEYFYQKRLDYKKENSPMEFVCKIILNSLYGKFGQKRIKKSRIIDMNLFTGDYDALIKEIGEDFLIKDNKILVNKEEEFNGKNVYPILSSYVTSYARILMYNYLKHEEVLYTDTDSCICSAPIFSHSKVLGEMKLEGEFKLVHIIKPKFYYTYDGEEYDVKIKGLSKADKKDFEKILNGETVNKMKFSKMKESIRRGFAINKKMIVPKIMGLTDDKRIWLDNESEPLNIGCEI